MRRRDSPVIEITDEMAAIGADDLASFENPANPAGFILAMKKALKAAGYAVKIPAWIERDS